MKLQIQRKTWYTVTPTIQTYQIFSIFVNNPLRIQLKLTLYVSVFTFSFLPPQRNCYPEVGVNMYASRNTFGTGFVLTIFIIFISYFIYHQATCFSLNISGLSILICIHIQFSSYRLFHFMNDCFSTYLSISFSMGFLAFLFSHLSLFQKVLQSTSLCVSVVSVCFFTLK